MTTPATVLPALTGLSASAPSAPETGTTEDRRVRWARQGCGRGSEECPEECPAAAAPTPTPGIPTPRELEGELGLGDHDNLTTPPSRREYLWTSDSQQTQFI